MDRLCRQCLTLSQGPPGSRCATCGSPRQLCHRELTALSIAHLDCDAFYAAIEKRDNPELADKPVIIGGGRRGVVSTACYIARQYGIHSAQPMFKALKACPHAVVLKPDMAKYVAAGRAVRDLMRSITPLVEPLSIDEAFMDLSGTERLHGQCPAMSLAKLTEAIEAQIGITVSVGLSHNKFLAKVASDLDKPRGFSVIGREDTLSFLASQPVSLIWGVGKAFQAKLARDGITEIAQLQAMDEDVLIRRYGTMGSRLFRLARGLDARAVNPRGEAKSVSSETTFSEDISDPAALEKRLWRLSEKVSSRLKKAGIAGQTVVLKLKTNRFRSLTRNRQLAEPTQLADVIFQTALPLLKREADGTAYRLIGVGVQHLSASDGADLPDLIDSDRERRAGAERAVDAVRAKFGEDIIGKGRGIRGPRRTS